jgi:hypothetical protein
MVRGTREGKIEDRLYAIAQSKQELEASRLEQSQIAPRKPAARPTNVVNRLIEYGQIVNQKKDTLRKQMEKGSFQPKINGNAAELSHNRSTIGGGRLSEVCPQLS